MSKRDNPKGPPSLQSGQRVILRGRDKAGELVRIWMPDPEKWPKHVWAIVAWDWNAYDDEESSPPMICSAFELQLETAHAHLP